MDINVTVTETSDTSSAFKGQRWLIVQHDLKHPKHCPTDHTANVKRYCAARVNATYFCDAQVRYGSGRQYGFGFACLPIDATEQDIEDAKATVLDNAKELAQEWYGDVLTVLKERAEDAARQVRSGDLDRVFLDDTGCIESDGEEVTAWAPHPCDNSEHIEASVKI